MSWTHSEEDSWEDCWENDLCRADHVDSRTPCVTRTLQSLLGVSESVTYAEHPVSVSIVTFHASFRGNCCCGSQNHGVHGHRKTSRSAVWILVGHCCGL